MKKIHIRATVSKEGSIGGQYSPKNTQENAQALHKKRNVKRKNVTKEKVYNKSAKKVGM
jgi:hypothetical protein